MRVRHEARGGPPLEPDRPHVQPTCGEGKAVFGAVAPDIKHAPPQQLQRESDVADAPAWCTLRGGGLPYLADCSGCIAITNHGELRMCARVLKVPGVAQATVAGHII